MFISDEKVVKGIRESNREVILYLYKKYFIMVRNLLYKFDCNPGEAKDVFQDVLLSVFSSVNGKSFNLKTNFKTYIRSVANNRIIDIHRHKTKVDISHFGDTGIKEENFPDNEKIPFFDEKKELFEKHFELLSRDCQKLLKLFIMDIPVTRITYLMKFNRVDYTQMRRYKCKKYLMESIFNDPKYKELTNEQHNINGTIPRW